VKQTGIGDIAYFGPEPEFFIFDEVRFGEGPNTSFYKVDSKEGRWNSANEEEGGNLGYKPDYKRGYFPVSPIDSQTDIRAEMALTLEKLGITVEVFHTRWPPPARASFPWCSARS